MNDIEDFTCTELLILIRFYNQFPNWRLIEKIIELENFDTLKDIIADHK